MFFYHWYHFSRAVFLLTILVILMLVISLEVFGPVLADRAAASLYVQMGVSPHCRCQKFHGTSSGKPAYTAVTVETRFGSPLIFAVRHMICSLPEDWLVMLISHESMRLSILAEFKDLLLLGKLRVWELSTTVRALTEICPDLDNNDWCDAPLTENRTDIIDNDVDSKPWPLDWKLSNEIWFSENVHRAIPTKYFIIFQTDGLLCKPLTPAYVKELEQYDYVGAPWKIPWWGSNRNVENGVGGNGGFSFRNRDVVFDILAKWKGVPIDHAYEDRFFSGEIYDMGGKLPSFDFARTFSVESVPYKDPLAFHKVWAWTHHSPSDYEPLFNHCPSISESLAWSQSSSRNSISHNVTSCEKVAVKNHFLNFGSSRNNLVSG